MFDTPMLRAVLLAVGVSLGGCGSEDGPPPRDPATAAAIAQLEKGTPDERLAAVRELATTTDPATARPLAEAAIHDVDMQVRLEAIRGLARPAILSDPKPLIALLDDPREEVRLAAAQALATFDTPQTVLALDGKLSDASPVVRLAAVRSLGAMADGRHVGVLIERFDRVSPEERVATLDVLGNATPEQVAMVGRALGGDRDEERLAAAEAAGRIASPTLAGPLESLAREPLSEARRAEIEARIAAGGQPEDIRSIAAQMNQQDLRNNNRPPADRVQRLLAADPATLRKPFEAMVHAQTQTAERVVRDAAVGALAKVGEGVAALLELMGDEDPAVAEAATAAVAGGGEGGEKGEARLRAVVLGAKRPGEARLRALTLLMHSGEAGPTAQQVLRERLTTEANEEQATPSEVSTDEGDDADADTDEGDALVHHVALPPPTRALLTQLLTDEDVRLRVEAAPHLAAHVTSDEADAAGVLPVLLEASRSEDAAVRGAAVSGLTSMRDGAAVRRLLELLRDTSASTDRQRVVRSLGRAGNAAAVEPLLAVVREGGEGGEGDLRVEAVQALGRIGDPAAGGGLVDTWEANEAARARTADREREKYLGWLNYHILNALGDVRAKEAVEPLLTRLAAATRDARGSGDGVSEMEALGKIGDPRAVEPIIARLENGNFRYKRHTNYTTLAGVTALGRLNHPRAVPVLDRFVKHPPKVDVDNDSTFTQALALQTLAIIDDPTATRTLVGYLADPDVSAQLKLSHVAPAIVRAGEKARDPLLRLVREAEPDEREDAGVLAAQLLALLSRDPASRGEVVEALRAMVGGGAGKNVLRRVVVALEIMPRESKDDADLATALLVRLLMHDDADVRVWSAVSLGKRGDAAALPALREAASGEDAALSRWATWAVERIQAGG